METDYKMNHIFNLVYCMTFVEQIENGYLKHNIIVDKRMQVITMREC